MNYVLLERFLHNLKGGKAMIKKDWAFALGILSLTTSMVAADQGNGNNKTAPAQPMGVTSQPSGIITPAVGPRVANGADVFLTADFIYWRTHQNGLEYAQSGLVATAPAVNTNLSSGTVQSPKARWQPGFKVGLGLVFEHDGWDIDAEYTWLAPSHKSNTITAATPSTLQNVWTDPTVASGGNTLIEQASASWRLSYNVLDLTLGRNFFVSRYLTLRPNFGLKGAWVKQRNNVDYVLGTLVSPSYTELEIRQKQRFWGVGVRAGLDTVWHFCKEFGMYGDMGLSALWGQYKNRRTDDLQTPAGSEGQTLNYRRSFHDVTPVLELGIGLAYMTWFYDEAYMFDIRAGWEEQVWFDTNHFFDSTGARSGNFTTQGLTVKVGFWF